MNNELRRELKNLKLTYFNFRYSIYYPIVTPVAAVLLCVLLIFLFVLPQLQSLFSIQNEIKATEKRIKTIKDNISYLQLTDNASIDADFNTATAALPMDKDFTGVVTTISNSAAASDVELNDYSFSPSSAAQQVISSATVSSPDVSQNGMTPIQVSLVVEGNIANINAFVRELEKRLPLAQLKEINYTEGKAQTVISFYTRAFPKVTLTNEQSINVLNGRDRALLQKLRQQNALSR